MNPITNEELSGGDSEDQNRYLTFSIGDVSYAFHIRNVTEIIGMQALTIVPDVPKYIKGVINLRGKVIPLMDIRLRLRLPEIPYHERTCIIVVEVGESSVGVIVDAVSDVLAIDQAQIEPPPTFQATQTAHYISGMANRDDGIEVILDVERLLQLEGQGPSLA